MSDCIIWLFRWKDHPDFIPYFIRNSFDSWKILDPIVSHTYEQYILKLDVYLFLGWVLSQSNIYLHFLIAESINISMYSLGVSSTPCCSSYFTQISKRAWYLSLSKRRLISYSFLSSILSFYGYSFINDTQYLAL